MKQLALIRRVTSPRAAARVCTRGASGTRAQVYSLYDLILVQRDAFLLRK